MRKGAAGSIILLNHVFNEISRLTIKGVMTSEQDPTELSLQLVKLN